MYKESRNSSTNKPSSIQQLPDFIIQGVPRQMEEDPETGWRLHILFFGRTSFVDEFCAHVSFLSGHSTPHPPHRHEHEELAVALSDHLEFVTRDSEVEKAFPLERGSLIFLDSSVAHSFRNAASRPADYLHVRWKSISKTVASEAERPIFYHSPGSESRALKRVTSEESETVEIYSGPSRCLPRLRALFTTIFPGGRIPLHRHAHEVVFLFISGSVEILGKELEAPGFAFMGSRMPHHIINNGAKPAEYYAFELHGEA